MKRSLPLLGIVLAVALPFAFGASAEPVPASPTLSLTPQPESCKPSAPIRVDLFAGDLAGGSARIDYELSPVMDVLDVEVEIVFPRGGSVSWHNAPARGPAERRSRLSGSLSAALPTSLPGVEVEVHAHVSIPDPDAPNGVGRYTTVRTATWGEVDRSVSGVTEVMADEELMLDTAATRF